MLVLTVVPLSPSYVTTTLFLKFPVTLYWFKRDRMTWAGVLLDKSTGDIGRCWSLCSIKPLPFVTLFGIFIVVAIGFWCLEAVVAGVITSRGTCSGFSANFHVTINIHFLFTSKKQQFFIAKIFCAREEKKRKRKIKIQNQFSCFSD